MARIGVDLDGVLYDFGDALRKFLNGTWGIPIAKLPLPQEWEFYKKWGFTDEGFVTACNVAADEGKLWGGYGPADNDSRALAVLQERGHTIHIITDRKFGRHPGVSQAATAKWLSQHLIPYDTLTFSADKTIVKTDYMIDDKIENYDALVKSGCCAVLRDRPWNQDVPSTPTYKRRRAANVTDFARYVVAAEDGKRT